MIDKVKYELEYLLKTSPKVLESMLCTPSGLSEWFADDVNIKDDIFTFIWDGSEEKARLLSKKSGTKAKFKWLEDEDDDNEYFFEMSFEVDPMTKAVVMRVVDFAEEDEVEESQMLWEQQVGELRRVLGA
jgi:hypothetical protein